MIVKAFSIHTHNGKTYYPGQDMNMTLAEKQMYETLAIGQRKEEAVVAEKLVDLMTGDTTSPRNVVAKFEEKR